MFGTEHRQRATIRQSTRSACTGLMEAARRAGIQPATAAASPSTPTAPASTKPSTDLISYSCELTYFTQSIAVGTPSASPTSACTIAPRITIIITFVRAAPTQEAAAEVLGLPFSTYRRHLATALDELVELLWAVEIGEISLPMSTD